MRNALWVTTAALMCSLAAGPARAQDFDAMVAFGDSLSDGGNISDLVGLPRARFTTNPGLTTVEYVASAYGLALDPSRLGGTNYAYGGAGFSIFGVPDLTTQAETYLAANPEIGANTLVFVWGGGNDIFSHGGQTPGVAIPALQDAARVEGALLDTLQAAGARNIVVINVPDIGQLPDGSADDTALSIAFNDELNAQLAGRTGVIPVNAFALVREIAADPAAFGYTNVTDTACTTINLLLCTPATLREPGADQTYLFADAIHPTTAAHASLARLIVNEISAPGQISMLSMAPFAALRGHSATIADQAQQASAPGWRVFLDARKGERTFDADSAIPGSKSDDDLLTLGAVWRSRGAFAFGAAISHGQSDMRIGDAASAVDAETLFGSVFAAANWDSGAWASGQLGFGATDYNRIQRSVTYGAASRTENAETSGDDLSAQLAAGRRFDLGALNAGPFASLTYERAKVDAFAETSGDATAMWFGDQEREATIARLGFDLGGATTFGGATLRPIARLAYAHDFSADGAPVTAGLTTMNGAFEMPGFEPSESWGELSLGLGLDFTNGLRASLAYQGAWAGNVEDNAANASLSLQF